MKKNKIIKLCVGIPASGKSTYCKNFVKNNSGWIRVSRDDFRLMLKTSGFCEPKIESLITDLVDNVIIEALRRNENVIVDATNCKVSTINEFIKKFNVLADIEFQIFDIPLAVAIKRDSERDASVGETVIKRMFENYINLYDSNFDFSTIKKISNIVNCKIEKNDKPLAYILDMDGTICHINGKRNMFDYNKVIDDDLDERVFETIKTITDSGKYKLIVVSGREDICIDDSKDWLKFHGIKYDQIFMRPKNDYRKDNVVKLEIYNNYIKDNYNVIGCFDDRQQVVSMWRDQGLLVYHVADGRF